MTSTNVVKVDKKMKNFIKSLTIETDSYNDLRLYVESDVSLKNKKRKKSEITTLFVSFQFQVV